MNANDGDRIHNNTITVYIRCNGSKMDGHIEDRLRTSHLAHGLVGDVVLFILLGHLAVVIFLPLFCS